MEMRRAYPAKVEDFGEKDLLQHNFARILIGEVFHFAGMRVNQTRL